MERQKFIEQFEKADADFDLCTAGYIAERECDRCHDLFPQYERGHMNIITAMEECAELQTALSHRMRERTTDNYEVLEEAADVIFSILILAQVFGFTEEDIIKAVNVKLERTLDRIEQHSWSNPEYMKKPL